MKNMPVKLSREMQLKPMETTIMPKPKEKLRRKLLKLLPRARLHEISKLDHPHLAGRAELEARALVNWNYETYNVVVLYIAQVK